MTKRYYLDKEYFWNDVPRNLQKILKIELLDNEFSESAKEVVVICVACVLKNPHNPRRILREFIEDEIAILDQKISHYEKWSIGHDTGLSKDGIFEAEPFSPLHVTKATYDTILSRLNCN